MTWLSAAKCAAHPSSDRSSTRTVPSSTTIASTPSASRSTGTWEVDGGKENHAHHRRSHHTLERSARRASRAHVGGLPPERAGRPHRPRGDHRGDRLRENL